MSGDVTPLGAHGAWWSPRSSKSRGGRATPVPGGFDSHTLPPILLSWYTETMLPCVIRHHGGIRLAVSILLGASVGVPAGAQVRTPLSQARINELAASLLRAHWALIEVPGLRHDGERIEAYMDRIASRQHGESHSTYLARVDSYVAAIERAAGVHDRGADDPTLSDATDVNVACWNRASRASRSLPAHAAKVREAWNIVRRKRPDLAALKHLGTELVRAFLSIKVEYDALRQARP